jgi:hypothetical protein
MRDELERSSLALKQVQRKIYTVLAYFAFSLMILACKPIVAQSPVATQTFSLTSTPTPTPIPKSSNTLTATPAATFYITPRVTATPVTETINTEDDLDKIVRRIYSWWSPCIGYNFAKESSEDSIFIGELTFLEVSIEPHTDKYWVSEIADNFDKSRQAFVLCEQTFCQDKIYFKDNDTQKIYLTNFHPGGLLQVRVLLFLV